MMPTLAFLCALAATIFLSNFLLRSRPFPRLFGLQLIVTLVGTISITLFLLAVLKDPAVLLGFFPHWSPTPSSVGELIARRADLARTCCLIWIATTTAHILAAAGRELRLKRAARP